MRIDFNTGDMESYRRFLRLRGVPAYHWHGRSAIVPDEYAGLLNGSTPAVSTSAYIPTPCLFDYQSDISALAIRKRRFAVFAECGLGKTLILLEVARHAASSTGKKILIVSPLMVVKQTVSESLRFYGDSPEIVSADRLAGWLVDGKSGIGITNYEAIKEGLPTGTLGGLMLDESSMLKSAYGAWGTRLIRLGRGVEFKSCFTGTPAPNDRIEYANHAVFLDHFRTTNEFLARYFVNRGQTDNRWELKPHALRRFYRDLSHWCIFLTNPAVYGWNDNCDTIPPIHVHVDHVPLTPEQRKACQLVTGGLIVKSAGGIGQRSKLSQIAKGRFRGKPIQTEKPGFIRSMVDSWPDESTLIWCRYNSEQDTMDATFPEAASIRGETSHDAREEMIQQFKGRECSVLVSKPKILGFGLNLQVATRQVFSGLQDSYEEFHQAVKRSNRIGSTRPLNVHIPVTEIEEPMVQTVLNKAHRVQMDSEEQELIFKECRIDG